MRVTIHQPNFLPWMGFFAKWASVDLFILLDNVPFTKGGYQNRVHIATPNGVSWLTVPVMTKKHLGQDSRDVAINPTKRWTKKHLKTLELSYRKYPFFDEVFPFMKETYAKSWVHLLPLNISLLESCAKKLHIEVPYVCASQYDLPPETGSKRLAQLVKAVGGTRYVSGKGGKKYNEEQDFTDAGLTLEYYEYATPTYEQPGKDFQIGLSIIDALACCGESTKDLL